MTDHAELIAEANKFIRLYNDQYPAELAAALRDALAALAKEHERMEIAGELR